jgi:hypothetical protein
VLVDAVFAYRLPHVSAGWIRAFDVETGRTRTLSRSAWRQLAARMQKWQDTVEQQAHEAGLDVLRWGIDDQQSAAALTEFIAERRLRKT